MEGRRPRRGRAGDPNRRLLADPRLGLLKHLALQENYAFSTKLNGESLGAPWNAADWEADDDWEFTSAADDTPEQLYALWDGAVEVSRVTLDEALADGGLDQLIHVSWPDGRHASLRRLLCDLIEEYGRHTGHADLLREAVDGLVGEDPPAGWQRVHRSQLIIGSLRRPCFRAVRAAWMRVLIMGFWSRSTHGWAGSTHRCRCRRSPRPSCDRGAQTKRARCHRLQGLAEP